AAEPANARSFGRTESDARIEQRVQHVCGQGGQGIDNPDHHYAAFQQRKILVSGGGKDETADAGIAEQYFDDDQTAHEITHLGGNDRDGRQQSVSEDMTPQYVMRLQSLEYGRARVIGGQRFDGPGTRHSRQISE